MPLAEHGLEWVHPAAVLRAPAARTARPTLLYRDLDGDRRDARSPAQGDGERWARVRAPVPRQLRRGARRRCSPASRPSAARCSCSTSAGPLRLLDFTRLLPGSAVGLGKRLFERRRLARLAVRRGDARRHAARRRRLGDRRLLPEPARARRRLAEPARRRRAAHRRARLLPREPRRRDAHRRARRAHPRARTAASPASRPRTSSFAAATRDRRRDAARAAADGRRAARLVHGPR